jgi:hypothetical protein
MKKLYAATGCMFSLRRWRLSWSLEVLTGCLKRDLFDLKQFLEIFGQKSLALEPQSPKI